MSRVRIVWLLLLLGLVRLAPGAVPPGKRFVSDNERYAVELSKTPENQVLVAVFDTTGATKALLWSRPINWADPYHLNTGPIVPGIRALVTNDGATVVLRDDNTPQVENGLRIIGRSEQADPVCRIFARSELTAMKPRKANPPAGRSLNGMRVGTSYLHVSALLDFILEDDKRYAIWFGQTDRWLLISLEDFRETLVQDPVMLEHLNRLAWAKAEALIAEHQPAPLRKMLSMAREIAGRILPSFRTPVSPRYYQAETVAAYLFLTTRRYAGDKHYIEGLLKSPADGIQIGYPRFSMVGPRTELAPLEINGWVSRWERMVGDFLMRRWNGETEQEFLTRETHLLVPQDASHYLGTIRVCFTLPIPVPRDNSGTLRAYLIPAESPVGEWEKSEDVIVFHNDLSFATRDSPFTAGPEGDAFFRGVTPGDYRVKLIWQRQRPTPPGGGRIYTAVAGDYESDETEPITVKMGVTVRTLLACTNRIGPSATYEADESTREHKQN